mmetsp:Transcript_45746/g.75706  ORF Transcript_45746/g.75706 Transcript_45746/m.75706 type:complete len:178 (+) Transcript_45746:153-686(+)
MGSNEVVAFSTLNGVPAHRFGKGEGSTICSFFNGEATPANHLSWPKGVVVHRGSVYVADTGHHTVKVFSRSGQLRTCWGRRGSADGEFEFPTGIGALGEHIFVSEHVGRRVQAFTLEGKFVAKVSVPGSGELMGLSVDKNHVYIVDDDEHCVWRLDRTGPCGLIEEHSMMRTWRVGA